MKRGAPGGIEGGFRDAPHLIDKRINK